MMAITILPLELGVNVKKKRKWQNVIHTAFAVHFTHVCTKTKEKDSKVL